MTRGWVLITRPGDDLGSFQEALAPSGFSVIGYPVFREVAVADDVGWRALTAALGDLHRIAFTSPRAPAALRSAAQTRGVAAELAAIPAAVVGEATARTAAAVGFTVAEVGIAGGVELARRIAAGCGRGGAVLHACGREHHADLAAGLEAHDVRVVSVVVYAMDPTPLAELPPVPAPPALVAVVLTSPRAAEAYAAASGPRAPAVSHLAMGPTTAARARELGIDAVTLRRPTPAAVLEELCRICP
jgi:uroporphyrinogen-III synthase